MKFRVKSPKLFPSYLFFTLSMSALCLISSNLWAESLDEISWPVKTKVIYLRKTFYEENRNPEQAIAKVISEGETIGYFVAVSYGDYEHFEIKDIDGKEDSFFISESVDDNLLTKFKDNKTYAGKKIKVIWNTVDIYMPEAGGNMEITVMMDLKIVE